MKAKRHDAKEGEHHVFFADIKGVGIHQFSSMGSNISRVSRMGRSFVTPQVKKIMRMTSKISSKVAPFQGPSGNEPSWLFPFPLPFQWP